MGLLLISAACAVANAENCSRTESIRIQTNAAVQDNTKDLIITPLSPIGL